MHAQQNLPNCPMISLIVAQVEALGEEVENSKFQSSGFLNSIRIQRKFGSEKNGGVIRVGSLLLLKAVQLNRRRCNIPAPKVIYISLLIKMFLGS
jgi:hypothetical protein